MSAVNTFSASLLNYLKARPEWVLIGITVLWGGTFLLVQRAMAGGGAFFFVGLRFGAAALIVGLVSMRVLRGVTRHELWAGACIGTAMMLGYALQTVALQTVSSSKVAFITAFYVPIVPLLQWLVLRQSIVGYRIGVVMAFVGLLLVVGPENAGLSLAGGELLAVIGAGAIAAEVVLISRFARSVHVGRVTVIQLAVASALCFCIMPVVGERAVVPSGFFLAGALALGAASALIQSAMNWAQKTVSPTRATVIYAGEPVWAGLIGRLAGERLPLLALLGAGLIVVGILIGKPAAETPTAKKRSVSQTGH